MQMIQSSKRPYHLNALDGTSRCCCTCFPLATSLEATTDGERFCGASLRYDTDSMTRIWNSLLSHLKETE